MKKENRYYDVTPRILPADGEGEVTIRPLHDHCRFDAGATYTVHHHLMDDSPSQPKASVAGTWSVKPDREGRLRFRSRFWGEQEHWVRVTPPPAANAQAIDLKLFSLRPDLFGRRPFKGDLHMHSRKSDGQESPAYVAAACRRIGLDFMAVTDHRRYAPSLEAAEAFAGVEHDLRICPGEEVHPPDVAAHLVNFGGRLSVNELFASTRYEREVKRLAAKIAGSCAPAVDPHQAAACTWCCRKIREAGGLAIYCHPHWMWGTTYNVSEAMNRWMFEHQPFDAFELIGGFHRHEVESNQLQVAWYNEQRAEGRSPPVVGNSDSHGCERDQLFGWYYTLVFSPSAEEVVESIRNGYSVAIESLPGDRVRPYGPYRLVKFALFLAREILPAHDELCTEEGRLMLEHLAGNPQAGAGLRRLSGRCASLYQRLWAPPRVTAPRRSR